MSSMTPEHFVAKWRAGGDERRDAQPFFERNGLFPQVGPLSPSGYDPAALQKSYP